LSRIDVEQKQVYIRLHGLMYATDQQYSSLIWPSFSHGQIILMTSMMLQMSG